MQMWNLGHNSLTPVFLDANISLITCRFFEVAAFPKPYYNPANLVKVGTGVKQK
jgi:hypothetical protein